jgi:hypothetical protein
MSTTTAVRERPILMSASMVKAILAGKKTQTRRVVRGWVFDGDESGCGWEPGRCPYGKPGDRLWVRETWWSNENWHESRERLALFPNWDGTFCQVNQHGFCQKVTPPFDLSNDDAIRRCGWQKKPSIHMPRWASRITLEISEERVERLQAISEDDAIAEGIESWEQGYPRSTGEPFVGYETLYGFGKDVRWVPRSEPTAALAFRRLWDSINGPGAWDANPWVWRIAFRRIDP